MKLTVNGKVVEAAVEPRVHLADFLREHLLLTGTHLGCEHGVCGACTLLIDGVPARSCIAFAAACEGANVTTIEGLEDDPVMVRLRAAFKAEHALQCGYCTPGMLVTARDIVLRLPNADEAQIRLELAGNLCRCTGYAGIVRAIRWVLAEGVAGLATQVTEALPKLEVVEGTPAAGIEPGAAGTVGDGESKKELMIRVARPLAEVWAALHDPALLAGCVPGARIESVSGETIRGEMRVALGPVMATFAGTGRLTLDQAARTANLTGEAADSRSRSRLSGEARIVPVADGAAATRIDVAFNYALRGPLAQVARGAIVQALAAEIAAEVARTLERRLAGDMAVAPARIRAIRLAVNAMIQWLRGWLGRS
jgi:carbon-monoxide dehydrogenase small subunit